MIVDQLDDSVDILRQWFNGGRFTDPTRRIAHP